MRHIESSIQINCVAWFRLVYPALARLLIAIPNGGARSRITGAIMKSEGVVAGVSDLFLFCPNSIYHGLAIEMKTPQGRQRPTQQLWQSAIESQGYRYAVCRSFDDFRQLIHDYLNG